MKLEDERKRMNTELYEALDLLEKTQNIPKAYMLERIVFALNSAYKKEHDGNDNVEITMDHEKQEIKVFQKKTVVEEVENEITEIAYPAARKIDKKCAIGDTVLIELNPKKFRRLSAQSAKQVIIQAIREAERGMIAKEYESKREELVTATVVGVDPLSGNAVVDTGTSTVTLPKNEQIPGESYTEGQHIKIYISEVKNEIKGTFVTVSRTHSGLVRRLFELEIPEIAEGTILIKGITREAGSRTKIAVLSRDENVDAVGSCIGARGARIGAIVTELNGEKIDVIQYSETPEDFIRAALSPADVKSVVLESEKSCKVFVDADQLSLAIGKEGQNARLAARLTGFKIDIKIAEAEG